MRENEGECARERAYVSVCLCARVGDMYARMIERLNESGSGVGRAFGVEREKKVLLYVAIIETMSVITLRIERQYKQFPYLTT